MLNSVFLHFSPFLFLLKILIFGKWVATTQHFFILSLVTVVTWIKRTSLKRAQQLKNFSSGSFQAKLRVAWTAEGNGANGSWTEKEAKNANYAQFSGTNSASFRFYVLLLQENFKKKLFPLFLRTRFLSFRLVLLPGAFWKWNFASMKKWKIHIWIPCCLWNKESFENQFFKVEFRWMEWMG